MSDLEKLAIDLCVARARAGEGATLALVSTLSRSELEAMVDEIAGLACALQTVVQRRQRSFTWAALERQMRRDEARAARRRDGADRGPGLVVL